MGGLVAELETEVWDLRDLKPDPENPRTHPKKGSPKWEALRKSLELDHFVIEGSANLRSSDNIEQITLVNDPGLLAFHTSWIDQLATAHA